MCLSFILVLLLFLKDYIKIMYCNYMVHMRLTTSPLFVTVMCLGGDITEEATNLTVSDKNYSKNNVSFNSDVIILTILARFSK